MACGLRGVRQPSPVLGTGVAPLVLVPTEHGMRRKGSVIGQGVRSNRRAERGGGAKIAWLRARDHGGAGHAVDQAARSSPGFASARDATEEVREGG